jgi:hypothetical protein
MAPKKLDHDTARKRLLSLEPIQRASVLRQCGDWRHTLRHVFINDMMPERCGRRFHCHAQLMIETALARL